MNKKNIVIFIISILLISILLGYISLGDKEEPLPDADKDGVPDYKDDFPNDPAASIDSDGDGYPDGWNTGKSQSDSTSIPPLEIDDLPDNPGEWKDSDGDGVGDKTDEFPDDPDEWIDVDKDGIGDNSDKNPTVDLSVSVIVNKFKITKKVDFLKWAQVYFKIKINDEENKYNNNGRLWKVWLNQEQSVSHEKFTYDIPDDTKEDFTDIEISFFDYDFFGNDDIIDINPDGGETSIKLKLDNAKNTINYDSTVVGPKASIWFEVSVPDDSTDDAVISKTYSWRFDKKNWKITVDIPNKTFLDYKNANIDRKPRYSLDKKKFVTSDEKVIKDVAAELNGLADKQGYSSVDTTNFILSFVQTIVKYADDNETCGEVEFWRYPVETLVEGLGDCEDSSVLYASIMDNLGYDVALLLYYWEEDDGTNLGHLAVGVHLSGNHGSYVTHSSGKKYYYCETTTPNANYVLGRLPPELEGKKVKSIIQV